MEITGNFDDRPISDGGSRLGEGGFGTVYKGLVNDKPVAVKKLNPVRKNMFMPISFCTSCNAITTQNIFSFRWMTSPWTSCEFSSTKRSRLWKCTFHLLSASLLISLLLSDSQPPHNHYILWARANKVFLKQVSEEKDIELIKIVFGKAGWTHNTIRFNRFVPSYSNTNWKINVIGCYRSCKCKYLANLFVWLVGVYTDESARNNDASEGNAIQTVMTGSSLWWVMLHSKLYIDIAVSLTLLSQLTDFMTLFHLCHRCRTVSLSPT